MSNTELSWTVVEGDNSMIDHFLVLCEYQGISSVIGVMHAFDDGRSYTFIDKKLSGAIGQRVYRVLPVMNNFTLGAMSPATPVITSTNLDPMEL